MNVHKGRKGPIQVSLTDSLLRKVDEIARREYPRGDDDGNRSALIRDLIGEAIDAREKGATR
jgi:metal-responsive CopG/Arc/MetJ family transcriptional regulator